MSTIPESLEAAISQAKVALKAALANGCKRITIDLVIPDISLKAQYLAWEFAQELSDYGSGLKVVFPDTGAAALARRDWGKTEFVVTDIGSSRTPVETKISDTDEIFLLVCPSAVEVNLVERLCLLAEERPVVMLIPQLEDIMGVGIGYAARQLRERFINTLESAYYFRPLEGAVVMRQYPHLWQVWREESNSGEYFLVAEVSHKPLGETLERILSGRGEEKDTAVSSPRGFFASLRGLFRALNN